MKPSNGKIIVRVDMGQKDRIVMNGIVMSTARKWETNYREKTPTLACVVEGNRFVQEGDIIVCHHNLFYSDSPHFLKDDLFSVPFSKILFAKVDKHGDLEPICGNLICEEIPIPSEFPLPPDQQKKYINRYKVLKPGWADYAPGDEVFTRPHSGYMIVYNWNLTEKRQLKVDSEMVCGVVKKK